MHNTFQVLILCLYLVFSQVPCTSGIPLKANRVKFHPSIEIELNFFFLSHQETTNFNNLQFTHQHVEIITISFACKTLFQNVEIICTTFIIIIIIIIVILNYLM